MAFTFNPFTGKFDAVSFIAKKIYSKAIQNVVPTNGQILQFNSSNDRWEIITPNFGDVFGPESSVDNEIVRFNSTTGKLIQGSTSNNPIISDDGIASFPEDDFANCERIGAGSSATGTGATVFGQGATGGQDTVAIGRNARGTVSRNQICIGVNSISDGFASSAIGSSANAGGSNSFAIGVNANAGGNFAFALGPNTNVAGANGVAIGNTVNVAHASIAIGRNASSTANFQAVFGGLFMPINTFCYGANLNGLASNQFVGDYVHYHGGVASGETNGNGRDVYYRAPESTGSGTGGSFNFQVTPSGNSGTARNSYATKFSINSEGVSTFGGSIQKPIRTITSNTTLNDSDYTVLVDSTSGDITVTLPSASGVTGRVLNIKKISSDTNRVILSGTVDGSTSRDLTVQYESLTIQNQSTNWWIL